MDPARWTPSTALAGLHSAPSLIFETTALERRVAADIAASLRRSRSEGPECVTVEVHAVEEEEARDEAALAVLAASGAASRARVRARARELRSTEKEAMGARVELEEAESALRALRESESSLAEQRRRLNAALRLIIERARQRREAASAPAPAPTASGLADSARLASREREDFGGEPDAKRSRPS